MKNTICNKVVLFFCASTVLGTILMTTVTNPAHGFIINQNGITEMRSLISGKTSTNFTIANSSIDTLGDAVEGIIALIKVTFTLALLFGLKSSYDKYTEGTN
jgi:hypothetical protein